ncbi:MAG: hypothetical protein EOO04_22235 [Chitinophagaceae bacterium]|nr:MAG: hypothetical protein EOO04_22235 [Chitinophagaceae bacterium]
MNKVLLTVCLLAVISTGRVFSQSSYPFKVSFDRMLWHENVDKQQKRLVGPEAVVRVPMNETQKRVLSEAIAKGVDRLQEKIELDSLQTGQSKTKYLRTLELLVKRYADQFNKTDFAPSIAPALLTAFEKAMELDQKGLSYEPVIEANEYGIGKLLVETFIYPPENPGTNASRTTVMLKYLDRYPDEILPELRKAPYLPHADSLIVIAAGRDIRKLYDYAASRNALGTRIRSHPDKLVKTVAQMANSKSGQLYFPFLDNVLQGKISIADIDKVKENDFQYYRLMVNTRIDYARRLLPPTRDTAFEMRSLTDMMARKAKDYFIREINALHAVENENVRFKRIEGLTPQELYYLIVLGEDEIYTSSYLNVYKRIFQRMSTPRSDSLLMSVNADYFRKFIKMAAGYNTLNDFMAKMGKGNDSTLIKAFVIGLERSGEKKNLEDAVDVADSYSSIMDKNPAIARYILDEVRTSYAVNVRNRNKKGMVIYNLLQVLFESADTTRKVDLSSKLGIPPVYSVDYGSLTDSAGRVVQQVFFYGDDDKDGQNSYINFMAMFNGRPEWKVTENPSRQWVTITSTRGKPVTIFANKPLYGENDPDAAAQQALIEYMHQKNLRPTVVIHRGHSYHLASTLKNLPSSAHIVVLGSCGGYNNLNEVLTISSDAHIISSKQVGTKTVNEPIIQAINNSLVAGKDIDWITMWKDLSGRFRNDAAAKEKFDDYIPPYKNLGAIFIKAYRKQMEE